MISFSSYVKPHAGVTAKTMGVWVTKLLVAAGVNTDKFKQLSLRSAAATFLREQRHLTVKQIVKLGDLLTCIIPIMFVLTCKCLDKFLYHGTILCIKPF